MADFKHRQLEIQLEFMRWSSAKRNNFNRGNQIDKWGDGFVPVSGHKIHLIWQILGCLLIPHHGIIPCSVDTQKNEHP